MRFVLAFSALVLSGIMLVLGIGQVTFLAGPHKVTYSTTFDAPNGLAVFNADQFDTLTGQANVVVEGDEPFVATGHVRDIEAWTAAFPHAEVTANAKSKSLESTKIPANSEAAAEFAELSKADDQEKIEVPSPFGSDLWLDQRGSQSENSESKTQTVRMPVSLDPDQAVIVSVAETSKSPKVSIEWVQDRRTPWAGPLLVGGGVFALLGAVLYLLAVDHDRRGLGPRRGRKGPLQGIRNVFSKSGSKAGEQPAAKNVKPSKGDATPKGIESSESDEAVAPDAGATSAEGATEHGEPKSGSATDENTMKRVAAPKKGKIVKRAFAVPALVVTAALGLSGCTANYWPDFSASEEVADAPVESDAKSMRAPVPVSQTQITRILGDIAALSGEADDSLDAGPLEARFTDEALTEREANYTIRKAVPDYEVVVPRITDQELGYQIVQSTEGWPRTIFVVVASETATSGDEAAADDAATDDAKNDAESKESPSLALVMTQENQYENFLVSRTIALRGGITMPEAAPAEEGAALLADDLATLALTPAQTGVDYSAVLAGGAGVAEAEKFNLEGDSLIERSGASWAAQSAEKAAANGEQINYSVSAAQQEGSILSLSTGTGGALVTTSVLETRVEAPPEGTRWRPTVPKSLTALSGLEGQQDKLVSVVAHQLLFFVPTASSGEKIQLLGYTSDLVSASNS
ncbi:glycosyltransferase [Leucobacter sp. UT-8R-CII-1-4]|uniref:glycosyltransferase n=1 Tax=Leucobacter sp. UT-8R-CII-1-4 TaxID=3040075 RepID=UPI0024A8AA1D|nr:glycosyltransferase [Leucobacter sp. UT-8R-CII-1-4]MDI6022906.1 glycosyltransferase [Leucobacter sp. UT-8R-CII-1-4]